MSAIIGSLAIGAPTTPRKDTKMTKNKILIDASHPEETRIAITQKNKIQDFDFESENKKILKGNIYLAKITRVEPSLQAAFVDYGNERHGFLAFADIHPDYYQIPLADKQAIIDAEEQEHKRKREIEEQEEIEIDEQNEIEIDAQVEGENVISQNIAEAPKKRRRTSRIVREKKEKNIQTKTESKKENKIIKKYKIQEVIKRRQIILIQVVKEERGNKGAALTTYLSLAGRYCVLMPNSGQGSGISRRITNVKDRKKMKSIARELKLPERMGVILRTAGAAQTKNEIDNDFNNLINLWENVREKTLESQAPCLVYEEAGLIKKTIRDIYRKNTSEIIIEGKKGYEEAKQFVKQLMPELSKNIKLYKDKTPLFTKMGVEKQLDNMMVPKVELKSGGYIIINQTEALVAIDVNSGKATKQHSVEETATQTNLEASKEIALQLKLRDLAGLIVIDFIDMEENKNNKAVERKMKEALQSDKAKVQMGRISQFGLLEMSRQRIRASVLESTMQICTKCQGTGHTQSDSGKAIAVIREIEEKLNKNSKNDIVVKTISDAAQYINKNKKNNIQKLKKKFKVNIEIEIDENVINQPCIIETKNKNQRKTKNKNTRGEKNRDDSEKGKGWLRNLFRES